MYQVLINGENIYLNEDGRLNRYGFYVNKFVYADNEEEASLAAINLTKEDDHLKKIICNNKDNPPIFSVEEISQRDDNEDVDMQQGYTWYPD